MRIQIWYICKYVIASRGTCGVFDGSLRGLVRCEILHLFRGTCRFFEGSWCGLVRSGIWHQKLSGLRLEIEGLMTF